MISNNKAIKQVRIGTDFYDWLLTQKKHYLSCPRCKRIYEADPKNILFFNSLLFVDVQSRFIIAQLSHHYTLKLSGLWEKKAVFANFRSLVPTLTLFKEKSIPVNIFLCSRSASMVVQWLKNPTGFLHCLPKVSFEERSLFMDLLTLLLRCRTTLTSRQIALSVYTCNYSLRFSATHQEYCIS